MNEKSCGAINRVAVRNELHRATVCACKPVSLFVDITRNCNLQCIMCFQKNEIKSTLPYEAFDRIRQFLPYVSEIVWQGGEVFSVNYFKGLFKRLVAEYPKLDHSIITNGLLIDDEWARLLAQKNVGLVFSVDAVTKQTYERIRVGGKFDQLVNRIDLVNREYGRVWGTSRMVMLNVVVMKCNLYELEHFPEFCRKHGIRKLRLSYMNPVHLPDEFIFSLENARLLEDLRRIVRDLKVELNRLGVDFECIFESLLGDSEKNGAGALPEGEGVRSRARCVRPWTNLYVNCNGTVWPHCICDVPVGNILENTIEEIWNGESMRTYRERIISGRISGWCPDICVHRLCDKENFEYNG